MSTIRLEFSTAVSNDGLCTHPCAISYYAFRSLLCTSWNFYIKNVQYPICVYSCL